MRTLFTAREALKKVNSVMNDVIAHGYNLEVCKLSLAADADRSGKTPFCGASSCAANLVRRKAVIDAAKLAASVALEVQGKIDQFAQAAKRKKLTKAVQQKGKRHGSRPTHSRR